MNQSEIQNTAVNLDGLLEVLGKNLYSDANVAIRELIQNAADACQRHRLEAGDADRYEIRIRCLPETNQLIIEDNGSGLTHDEVKQFLATIGSGYSRLLRHETGTEDVVGYFGLGFLTAYIVGSKVQVSTCSYKTPDQTWIFTSAKGRTYAIAPGDGRPRGTRVVLWLEKEYRNLANIVFLRRVIEKYCCLLETQIYLNDEKDPVNQLKAPWRLDEPVSPLRFKKISREFAEIFEDSFEPIAVLSIPPDNEYELSGLLWVQGDNSYATSDNRNLSLFSRNMFITNEDKDLLPRWAGFVGGVLESAKFKPTASRESLQRDKYYKDVGQYILNFLIGGLRDLVLGDPATWRRVLSRHGQALLGAAISDDRLFEASCKTLKVPTTEGEMTIPELLRRGDGKIYIKPSNQSGHEEVLFRARGNPLVKGYLYGATGFCRKYNLWNDTPLYTLGTQDSQSSIFEQISLDNKTQESLLLDLFESNENDVVLTRFEPKHIPILVMENHDIIVKNKIESDEADKRIGSAVLSLARLTTATETKKYEHTVFVNLDNNIIQKMPNLDAVEQKNIAMMIKSMMEIICSDSANLSDGMDSVFQSFDKAVTAFISKGE